MKMFHHGQLPQGTIHPPHNWHVGDLSEITPTALDLNKWALVEDTYYRLSSVTPVQWIVVGEATKEQNPELTYTEGRLSRITYSSGNYKDFIYTGNLLSRIEYNKGGQVLVKQFIYQADRLIRIEES